MPAKTRAQWATQFTNALSTLLGMGIQEVGSEHEGAEVDPSAFQRLVDALAAVINIDNPNLTRLFAQSVTLPILAPDGTAAAPSYSWAAEPGMGLYRFSAGLMSFAFGGVTQHGFSATQQRAPFGTAAAPGHSFHSQTNAGMYFDSATAELRFSLAALNALRIRSAPNPSIVLDSGQFLAPGNTPAAPSYGLLGEPTTGMYQAALGLISFATQGGARFFIRSFAIEALGSGSASVPTYTWSIDQSTGMYRIGAGMFGFTVAGAERARFQTDLTRFQQVVQMMNPTPIPVAGADMIQIYSSDIAVGHTIPTIDTEGTQVVQAIAAGPRNVANLIKLRINGVTYSLHAD